MSFEEFLLFGLIAFASGMIACPVDYLRKFQAPRPPGFRYFGVAVIVAVASYLVGSFAGIGVMCASPSSGNLCGIWGALVTGPLLGGLSLWLYGPAFRRLKVR